jgi:hypothetical protein
VRDVGQAADRGAAQLQQAAQEHVFGPVTEVLDDYLGRAYLGVVGYEESRFEDRPAIEWMAPGVPRNLDLYNAYLATLDLPTYTPRRGVPWHELPDPRVAWYVWNGVHSEEAERRVNAPSIHEQELARIRERKSLPPLARVKYGPLVVQSRREDDLVRLTHAMESLRRLAESGHPEYWGYYLVAREIPIHFRDAMTADAQTFRNMKLIHLTDSAANRHPGGLIKQLVHEAQHAYDWYWYRRKLVPKHSIDDVEGYATPLEDAAESDYLKALSAGHISEEFLPPEFRSIAGRKKPKS